MCTVVKLQQAADGTVKFLVRFTDGCLAETVLMRHPYGNSVCVSSQVGCSMGCRFCASGLFAKTRNLSAEEMLGQVISAADFLRREDQAVTHIVVMGTGEPFDNYDEVIRFCDLASDEKVCRQTGAGAVAPRHITVSTCGIVPKIRAFAETKKRYNLAISLHAPDNEIRNLLMPVNKACPVEEVVKAAGEYCTIANRRVTFEYLLLEGVNDSPECAVRLAGLLEKGKQHFYVNLIPYNHVSEFGFRGSSKEKALEFYDILMKNGIKATLRKERGADIAAACGQLRVKEGNPGNKPAQTEPPDIAFSGFFKYHSPD